jgi:hypothetical protein
MFESIVILVGSLAFIGLVLFGMDRAMTGLEKR